MGKLMTDLLASLRAARVVPVLRSATAAEAASVARALASGGMQVVELTYSTPDVTEAIRELSSDSDLIVGAGTVMNESQAHQAIDAGAKFLVSPVWLPWLPRLAAERSAVAIPGASSPSEVWAAYEAGATAVKVFPIMRLGGAAYIRDLLAPMPSLHLMATGGVGAAEARSLLDAGCFAVGVGLERIRKNRRADDEQSAKSFLNDLG